VELCGECLCRARSPPVAASPLQQQTESECCIAGGTLPEGWDCALRFRITSRRHGRQGVTTDNFYYSPCGKTLRTHKQVAESLGLQPLTKDQMKQQQFRSDDLAPVSEQFSVVSFTFLDSVSGAAASASSKPNGKRSHSAMAATDTAAGSPACSPLQQHQPACSAPAALAGSTLQAVSCSLEAAHQLCCSSGLPAPPAVQQPAAKRTKAALAAKYNSTASCNFASPSSAAVTAMGAAAASSVLSCQTSGEGSGAVCSQPGLAAAVATGCEDQTQQPLPQHLAPAQPAASSTSPSRGSSSKAVSSRLVVPAAAQKRPQPQQQCRVVQPVPKPWKPRAQPAWRAKLRELATAAVLAEELSAATHTG
jgi:hypothetical protein